jgi:hypothetical protein
MAAAKDGDPSFATVLEHGQLKRQRINPVQCR